MPISNEYGQRNSYDGRVLASIQVDFNGFGAYITQLEARSNSVADSSFPLSHAARPECVAVTVQKLPLMIPFRSITTTALQPELVTLPQSLSILTRSVITRSDSFLPPKTISWLSK